MPRFPIDLSLKVKFGQLARLGRFLSSNCHCGRHAPLLDHLEPLLAPAQPQRSSAACWLLGAPGVGCLARRRRLPSRRAQHQPSRSVAGSKPPHPPAAHKIAGHTGRPPAESSLDRGGTQPRREPGGISGPAAASPAAPARAAHFPGPPVASPVCGMSGAGVGHAARPHSAGPVRDALRGSPTAASAPDRAYAADAYRAAAAPRHPVITEIAQHRRGSGRWSRRRGAGVRVAGQAL